MLLKVAENWFEKRQVDEDITLLWEPHVVPLDRCNIWHIRGRDRDLLIDSGQGVCSLRSAAADLFGHQTIALATHSHYDHTGCFHEFEQRAAHPAEITEFTSEALASLRVDAIPEDFLRYLDRVGYGLTSGYLITALSCENFPIDSWRQTAAQPTWLLDEGDVIDLGNRQFEVLHLPGHSPGCIGLWEARTGTLFSGDAIYDGPLLDELPESNIVVYLNTMERLMNLPVKVVHAGHDPSFDVCACVKLRNNTSNQEVNVAQKIFLDYDEAQLYRQYNIELRDDWPHHEAEYLRLSDKVAGEFKQAVCNIPYGDSPNERLDVYPVNHPAPPCMFLSTVVTGVRVICQCGDSLQRAL